MKCRHCQSDIMWGPLVGRPPVWGHLSKVQGVEYDHEAEPEQTDPLLLGFAWERFLLLEEAIAQLIKEMNMLHKDVAAMAGRVTRF